MERLTQKNNGVWEVKFRTADGMFVTTQQVIDRLAAYENTYKEPEEIRELDYLRRCEEEAKLAAEWGYGIDPERLSDIIYAEKEGRLLVLPLGLGAALYLPEKSDWGDIIWFEVIEIGLDRDGPYFVVDDEEHEHIPMKDIGKSIFLTREEAEAAAKKEVDDNA